MAAAIYTEQMALAIIKAAVLHDQCAALLNTLADGGAVTIGVHKRLVFIDSEQVAWLASGGTEGHA